MDLRQMRYVVTVADHGGFTAAAQHLRVAQPSVSQAVALLERELGTLLFHRLGRRVVLTPAGEALIGPARRMLREASSAAEAVAAVHGLDAGHLDLVGLPAVAADPLARLIGVFRSAHPGVQVRVAEPDTAAEAWAMVADGRAEVALAEIPPEDGSLVAEGSFTQELLVVAPPDADLGGPDLAPADLARWPLILPPPGTSTRRLLDQALRADRIVANVGIETAQRESIVPLVLAGAGVAVLPEATARRAREAGAKVARLRPPLIRTLGLIHRPGPVSPAASAFVALALEDEQTRQRGAAPRRPPLDAGSRPLRTSG